MSRDPDPAALYRAHFHEVQRWIRYCGGGSEADIADLTQQTFLIVHEQIGRVPVDNPKGWLMGIAFNLVRSHRRSSWLRRVVRGAPPPAELFDPASPSEVDHERRRLLERSLLRLNVKLRLPLILHVVEGYTLEEIAALQGVSANTVASRVRLARAKLRELARRERSR